MKLRSKNLTTNFVKGIDNPPSLLLLPLLDPLVKRFQHAGINRGNHVDRGVQFFFSHPCFPCVRKAPLDSRIAKAHHRYG
jgi:hypothetical protein